MEEDEKSTIRGKREETEQDSREERKEEQDREEKKRKAEREEEREGEADLPCERGRHVRKVRA